MKYFLNTINILLIIAIPTTFVLTPTTKEKNKMIKTQVEVKKLESGIFNKEVKAKEQKEDNKNIEDEKIEEKAEATKTITKQESQTQKIETSKRVVEEKVEVKPQSDILETQVGKMSGYGVNCKGCSGYLANGRYVGDGNIYYNDKKYGQVRIVAGDYSYKFGTIVRIKNSKAGNNIIAIVLDRGGSIGFGKKFLFDLLYKTESEAAKDEVSYNTTFEILRYGY